MQLYTDKKSVLSDIVNSIPRLLGKEQMMSSVLLRHNGACFGKQELVKAGE